MRIYVNSASAHVELNSNAINSLLRGRYLLHRNAYLMFGSRLLGKAEFKIQPSKTEVDFRYSPSDFFDVHTLSELELTVPENDIRKVKSGQSVNLSFNVSVGRIQERKIDYIVTLCRPAASFR